MICLADVYIPPCLELAYALSISGVLLSERAVRCVSWPSQRAMYNHAGMRQLVGSDGQVVAVSVSVGLPMRRLKFQ